MKKLFIVLLGSVLLTSCASTEEASTAETSKSYGPVAVDASKAISVKEMLDKYEGQSGEMEVTFEGKLTQVCSKAGCWVNIDKGNGETFMVRFKDHFTIPTDTKVNSEAYLHGVLFRDTVSVDMLKHFAEDAGESQEEIDKITEPKYELGFTADGITLK